MPPGPGYALGDGTAFLGDQALRSRRPSFFAALNRIFLARVALVFKRLRGNLGDFDSGTDHVTKSFLSCLGL